MTKQHPITPSHELIAQWENKFVTTTCSFTNIAHEIAQWGADQELQACINVIYDNELCDANFYNNLRATRRPKQPSLKKQALSALSYLENGANATMDTTEHVYYISRALEQLPND
jgi:hypothetical protein